MHIKATLSMTLRAFIFSIYFYISLSTINSLFKSNTHTI